MIEIRFTDEFEYNHRLKQISLMIDWLIDNIEPGQKKEEQLYSTIFVDQSCVIQAPVPAIYPGPDLDFPTTGINEGWKFLGYNSVNDSAMFEIENDEFAMFMKLKF